MAFSRFSEHSGAMPTIDNLIVGLGRTGLSVARFLASRGHLFAVADNRLRPPGLEALRAQWPECELHLGEFDSTVFQRARRLIVSPGVALSTPKIKQARAKGAEILGDIEVFARENNAPVAAITGSNGKSTVTTLLGEMARQAGLNVAVGGNLGTPALDFLQIASLDLIVLELSSFQLETCESLASKAAVNLNISPDHLDRYASLDAYAAAKGRIYVHAERGVFNRQDLLARKYLGNTEAPSFGLDAPPRDEDYGVMESRGEIYLVKGRAPLLPASQLRIKGSHNLANALAALAMGASLGLPEDAMLTALRQFRGLPHRCQWIGKRRGVDWFDDSKGTNVGATMAAIKGLDGPLVLIAGGQGKGQDFGPLRQVAQGRLRAVVLIGEAAAEIESALEGVAPILKAEDMREAVNHAAFYARSGDNVLLSPACASFDMFRDYAARGKAFFEAFEELPA